VQIPVFIDSPLGLEITKIYARMAEFWDQEAKELKAHGNHPIDFKHLYSVERFRDHKWLLAFEGPGIIIAGSGMCTGGRILDHLKHGLEDSKNDIFFVGYQARGTLGRRIVEKRVAVRARVHTLSGYSAHADQADLVDWVMSMGEAPKEIRLVHGEAGARKALAKALGIKNIKY
jgi:metallo-beta-lactamase family protein